MAFSTFTDNTPSQVVAGNVGLKLSKPTYNAENTAGQNLIFSSSWPSLQIAFQLTITTAAQLAQYASLTQFAIPHNLGYSPLTFYWQSPQDGAGINNTMVRSVASVDKTYAYISAPSSTETSGASPSIPPINIKCFALDLTKDADYPLQPGRINQLPYDKNFGIKIAKYGKSVQSTDMRDFILHSRCQSPLVLAVKTQKTMSSLNTNPTGGTIQYTSKLNYPAWVYGFTANSSKNNLYTYAPYYSQSYPKTTTNGTTSYITYTNAGVGDNGATIVVLRDPMFAPTQTVAKF